MIGLYYILCAYKIITVTYSKLLGTNNDIENSHDLKEKEQMLNEEFISIIDQHRSLIRYKNTFKRVVGFFTYFVRNILMLQTIW